MRINLKIILLLTVISGMLYGQTLKHPWSVQDGGGGKSLGGPFYLTSSVGQPGVQKMNNIDTSKVIESGYIPGIRVMGGALTAATLSFDASWNLLSVPLLTSDMRKIALYPTAISSGFIYEPGGYIEVDTLKPGRGYWVKFASIQSRNINGTQIGTDTIPVFVGWNMIGGLTYPILVSSVTPIAPVGFVSSFFGYANGVGYYEEDTLKPGQGYWIKVNHAGNIVLNNLPLLANIVSSNVAEIQNVQIKSVKKVDATLERAASISVRDHGGKERKLYFGFAQDKQVTKHYELPPIAPTEILDVRYSSQRYAEFIDANSKTRQEYPIKINGGEFPYVFSWNETVLPNMDAILEVKYSGEKSKEYKLAGKGEVIIKEEGFAGAKLIILPSQVEDLPIELALHQNYPNPFNPVTAIRYDLPYDSRVQLKIYNLLGQEIAVLVDEVQQAGYKVVEWDTRKTLNGELSSGIYFYRLEVGDYTAIKKLILIK